MSFSAEPKNPAVLRSPQIGLFSFNFTTLRRHCWPTKSPRIKKKTHPTGKSSERKGEMLYRLIKIIIPLLRETEEQLKLNFPPFSQFFFSSNFYFLLAHQTSGNCGKCEHPRILLVCRCHRAAPANGFGQGWWTICYGLSRGRCNHIWSVELNHFLLPMEFRLIL